MGYEISGHIFDRSGSLAAIGELASVAAYTARSDGRHVLLELSVRDKPGAFAFLENRVDPFPEPWHRMAEVFSTAGLAFRPEVAKQSATAARLSAVLKTPVLGFIADDDELDAALVAKRGQVVRIRFEHDLFEIAFDGRAFKVSPLRGDDEDDPPSQTLLDAIAAVDGVTVRKRALRFEPDLHRIVIEEIERFIGGAAPEWSELPSIPLAGVPSAATIKRLKQPVIDPKFIARIRSAREKSFRRSAFEAAALDGNTASLNAWSFSKNALTLAMISLRVENDLTRATQDLTSALPFLCLLIDKGSSEPPEVDRSLLEPLLVAAALGAADLAESLAQGVRVRHARRHAHEWDRFPRMLAAALLDERALFDEDLAAVEARKSKRGYDAALAPYVPALNATFERDGLLLERALGEALDLFGERPRNRSIEHDDLNWGGKLSDGFAIDYLSVFAIRLARRRSIAFRAPESRYIPQELIDRPLVDDIRAESERILSGW